jgi:hypothetical protein
MNIDNHYGYDQVYIDPINGNSGSYQSYTTSLIQPTFTKQEHPPQLHPPQQTRPLVPIDVYDYLEKTANVKYRDKVEDLQKKISEYQYKHDMFLIFIICLVVYIICNSPKSNTVLYYDNTLTRPIPVPISF